MYIFSLYFIVFLPDIRKVIWLYMTCFSVKCLNIPGQIPIIRVNYDICSGTFFDRIETRENPEKEGGSRL